MHSYRHTCGIVTARKTQEPANCRIIGSLRHLCFFSAGIQMPPSSKAGEEKKPTLCSCQDNQHFSHQTSHCTTHSGALSFASLLAQQHRPFCWRGCLAHHHQGIPGEAGSRHAGYTSSVARQSPLSLLSNMGPMVSCRAAAAEARDCCKDPLWSKCYISFFVLLRQLIFLCPRELSALVTQQSYC